MPATALRTIFVPANSAWRAGAVQVAAITTSNKVTSGAPAQLTCPVRGVLLCCACWCADHGIQWRLPFDLILGALHQHLALTVRCCGGCLRHEVIFCAYCVRCTCSVVRGVGCADLVFDASTDCGSGAAGTPSCSLKVPRGARFALRRIGLVLKVARHTSTALAILGC